MKRRLVSGDDDAGVDDDERGSIVGYCRDSKADGDERAQCAADDANYDRPPSRRTLGRDSAGAGSGAGDAGGHDDDDAAAADAAADWPMRWS